MTASERVRLGVALAVAASCGAPPTGPAAPSTLPCEAPHRAALAEVAKLRERGELDHAVQAAASARGICAPLSAEAAAAQMDLLVELGDDEAARELAASISAGEAPPAVAERARAVAARPPRPRTAADLRAADALRASGDLAGARAAYEKAVDDHPRDPAALAALGELGLALGDQALARRSFDRALRAAGRRGRVVTFEPFFRRGPTTHGSLRPDAIRVSEIARLAPGGARFPHALAGSESAPVSGGLLLFGEAHPLTLVSPDGRDLRPFALGAVTRAAEGPGDGALLAVSEGSVFRLDRRTGAVLGRRPAKGGELRFAGPTRLAVGEEVFRYPELTPVTTIPPNADLGPGVIVYSEARGTPKGQHTFVVVRSADDGNPIFERDIGEQGISTVIGIHPSGRFVGWIGYAPADRVTQGGILDVRARKVTSFPYEPRYQATTAALRITADGKAACAFDAGWTPSRTKPGHESLCWIHEGEARIAHVRMAKGFGTQLPSPTIGGISPDGRLAAFAEVEGRYDERRFAVRVIDVATGADVLHLELGRTKHFDVHARMVTNTVVRVSAGEAFDGDYDVHTGAREKPPADAREPDPGVLPRDDRELVRGERANVSILRGMLEIKTGRAARSCWTPELRRAPLEDCKAPNGDAVNVESGEAEVPGRSSPVRLSGYTGTARGFMAKVGETGVLVMPGIWMARYFDLEGKPLGAVAALGDERLVAFLPDGSAELVGEGDAGKDLLACLSGDRVLPIEACGDVLLPAGSFVRALGGTAGAATP